MKLLHKIKHDFVEILPPTTFFFLAFSLVLLTKSLILSEYGISWTGFGSAVVGAILVEKVVLLVDKLTFLNKMAATIRSRHYHGRRVTTTPSGL